MALQGGRSKLWRKAVSVSGPMVQIVVPFHDLSPKIFHGPDATLHNALHDNFEDFDLKLPCSITSRVLRFYTIFILSDPIVVGFLRFFLFDTLPVS